MRRIFKEFPEIAGLAIAIIDASLRLLAAVSFEPSEARIYGHLLLGNVHHHNEVRALGWSSMQWFGVGAGLLAILYAGVRLGEYGSRPGNAWFLAARAMLGSVAGVLALNVLESLATSKVTNYVGWVFAGRFTAINLGDVAVWVASGLLLPTVAVAFVLALQSKARVG